MRHERGGCGCGFGGRPGSRPRGSERRWREGSREVGSMRFLVAFCYEMQLAKEPRERETQWRINDLLLMKEVVMIFTRGEREREKGVKGNRCFGSYRLFNELTRTEILL